jgi:flagellar motility protein MotE (MotC chaperone)
MRTGLLKAAEKRIEEKLTQLKALQASINTKIKERDEKVEPRMQSLVKIYEKMKAKDAARIFAKLDLDILLEVIQRMKEAKSAPILAAMDPTKAKEVTVQLARQSRDTGIPGR